MNSYILAGAVLLQPLREQDATVQQQIRYSIEKLARFQLSCLMGLQLTVDLNFHKGIGSTLWYTGFYFYTNMSLLVWVKKKNVNYLLSWLWNRKLGTFSIVTTVTVQHSVINIRSCLITTEGSMKVYVVFVLPLEWDWKMFHRVLSLLHRLLVPLLIQ